MNLTFSAATIISTAAVLGAIITVFSAIFTCYRWYLKQEKQSNDIERLKKEDTLICFALSACLDGLQQLGANHNVPTAKAKLDKYLNCQAHQ